jgi:hypothetical protein
MRTRSLQVEHLSNLVDYLIAGARHIERQKTIIQELQRDGHDIAQAQQTLQQMEELHKIYLSEKDRLLKELAQDGG